MEEGTYVYDAELHMISVTATREHTKRITYVAWKQVSNILL